MKMTVFVFFLTCYYSMYILQYEFFLELWTHIRVVQPKSLLKQKEWMDQGMLLHYKDAIEQSEQV